MAFTQFGKYHFSAVAMDLSNQEIDPRCLFDTEKKIYETKACWIPDRVKFILQRYLQANSSNDRILDIAVDSLRSHLLSNSVFCTMIQAAKMNREDRLERTMSMAHNKGLLNLPGENNCFLNSAVQVRQFLSISLIKLHVLKQNKKMIVAV